MASLILLILMPCGMYVLLLYTSSVFRALSDTRSQLTKSLLKRDFGLKVDMPSDRLCPPVRTTKYHLLSTRTITSSSTVGQKLNIYRSPTA